MVACEGSEGLPFSKYSVMWKAGLFIPVMIAAITKHETISYGLRTPFVRYAHQMNLDYPHKHRKC